MGRWLYCSCIVLIGFCTTSSQALAYTLAEAIYQAQQHDPWLTGSIKRQERLEALSDEAGSLPAPTVSLGLANLPVDSFDFAQEPMTQFTVSVAQRFPRGKSLSLEKARLAKLSEAQPHSREERRAMLALRVTEQWLEAYRHSVALDFIDQRRSLFDDLVSVAKTRYRNTTGKAGQKDLLSAQLELSQLDHRLLRLRQQRDTHLAALGEWLAEPAPKLTLPDKPGEALTFLSPPKVEVKHERGKPDYHLLSQHPSIRHIDTTIDATALAIDLAKQSDKPEWGIKASYGYRDKDPMGDERADFFSIGLNFDLPLLTKHRQDKKVQAAKADKAALQTERILALKKLNAEYHVAHSRYQTLLDQLALFESRLLPQMTQQAEAALSAYTSDKGNFADVLHARIIELNGQIDALNIRVDIQQIIAKLQYLLATSTTLGNERKSP